MNTDIYITSGLLELYVMGALPDSEMRSIHQAVKEDARLLFEVQAIEDVLQKYTLEVSESLETDLLPSILDQLETQAPQVLDVSAVEPERQKPQISSVQRNIQKEAPVRKKKVEKQSSSAPWAWTLVILLLLGLGGAAWYINQQQEQLNALNTALIIAKNESTTHQDSIQLLKNALTDSSAKLGIYQNHQYKTIVLQGVKNSPESSGIIYYHPEDGIVYLKIIKLPKPAEGMRYQLWSTNENDSIINVGMLPSDITFGKLMKMHDVRNASYFAITMEPNNGSEVPDKKKMYLEGQL